MYITARRTILTSQTHSNGWLLYLFHFYLQEVASNPVNMTIKDMHEYLDIKM